MTHHADNLVMLFNALFRDTYRTVLVQGGEEPEYVPATRPDDVHRVIFTHDYFASALHEVSHWCIAGERRRKLVDYGYWYAADGRNRSQQTQFEKVEVKPQALEWIFSEAAGSRFRISLDNLSGEGGSDEPRFRCHVARQARNYISQGLPTRARQFVETLKTFYQRPDPLTTGSFTADDTTIPTL